MSVDQFARRGSFYMFALVTGGTASSFFFILGVVFSFHQERRNHSLNTHTHTQRHTHKGEKSVGLLYPNSTARRRPIKTRKGKRKRKKKRVKRELMCRRRAIECPLFSSLLTPPKHQIVFSRAVRALPLKWVGDKRERLHYNKHAQ
jgi:hypothetical protein